MANIQGNTSVDKWGGGERERELLSSTKSRPVRHLVSIYCFFTANSLFFDLVL